MCSSERQKRRQICLFGTSANPPTGDGGHVQIVNSLSELQRFDEIRILPVYRHTFSSKRDLVSYEHRMNMCKVAFSSIPNAQVSDAEQRSFDRMARNLSEQEKGSLRVGTADLMEMLIEEEPESDFTFCLGADTFLDLTEWKWKRSRDVLRLLGGRILVLNRKGVEANLEERVERVNESESGNVVLLNVPSLKEVSSSAVRSCAQIEKLQEMITSGVFDYIKTNRLYTFGDEST